MNFIWNSNFGKTKKKYSQKSIESYFSKSENSPSPPGAVQKRLVNNEDFEKEKKLAEEQKEKEMEERKQRKRERRWEIASKTKEPKRIKKAEKEKANE